MTALRSILHLGVAMVCFGLVATGLLLSAGDESEGIVLNKPGEPGRLRNDVTSATAFFEVNGDLLELTMLFTEPNDPDSISRRSIRLTDGQTHTLVIGGSGEHGVSRFFFRRVGYAVEMRQTKTATLHASLSNWN